MFCSKVGVQGHAGGEEGLSVEIGPGTYRSNPSESGDGQFCCSGETSFAWSVCQSQFGGCHSSGQPVKLIFFFLLLRKQQSSRRCSYHINSGFVSYP